MNAVEMRGIVKRFGDLVANDHVDFELRRGEIHGLLGENGAGKTTLMRILYGLYSADEGELIVNGQPAHVSSPKDAIGLGIGMVTQHFALVPPLSVTENVILGYTGGFRVDIEEAQRRVAEASGRFGVEVDPLALVRNLSVGQRQRVEILKALYRDAHILILDEPTAVLVPQEVDVLFETLRRLQADGLSVVFISHKLNEVMAITNRVTVLRDGKAIGTVETKDTNQTDLARMMVGRETFGVTRDAAAEAAYAGREPVLSIRGLNAVDNRGLPVLKGVNLEVYPGEILGLAGVSGNGQPELGQVLAGTRRPTGGQIVVGGRDVTGLEPSEIMGAGLGRISEDRHASVINELSVAQNMALEHLGDFVENGMLNHRQMREVAQQLIKDYQIKAKAEDRIRTLSGGNMQKVVLARVLSRSPKVVVVAQPTRGLDVGATEYVRQRLLEQREKGAGVLLISEDLDEILALSDRIAVIYEGQIVGVLPAEEANAERLGLLMCGAVREEVAA